MASISNRPPAAGIRDVDEEHAAARAVLRRREVIGLRAGLNRLDVAIGPGQDAEPVAHRRPRPGHRRLRCRHDVRAVRVVQLRVRPHPIQDRRDVRRAQDILAQHSVFTGEVLDLREAHIVDRLRGPIDGRVVADQPVVRVVPVGDPAQADVVLASAAWCQVIAEEIAIGRDRRPDLPFDDVPEPPQPRVPVVAVGGWRQAEQGVLGDRRRQPSVELLDGSVDGEPRRDAALRQSLAVTLTLVVEGLRDRPELVDHLVGDLGRRQCQLGQVDRQDRLDAGQGIDHDLGHAGFGVVGAGPGIPRDHRPGDPLLRVEVRLGDGVGASGEVARGGDLGVLRGPGHVLESVHEPVVGLQMRIGRPRALAEVVVVGCEPVKLVGHEGAPSVAMGRVQFRLPVP